MWLPGWLFLVSWLFGFCVHFLTQQLSVSLSWLVSQWTEVVLTVANYSGLATLLPCHRNTLCPSTWLSPLAFHALAHCGSRFCSRYWVLGSPSNQSHWPSALPPSQWIPILESWTVGWNVPIFLPRAMAFPYRISAPSNKLVPSPFPDFLLVTFSGVLTESQLRLISLGSLVCFAGCQRCLKIKDKLEGVYIYIYI